MHAQEVGNSGAIREQPRFGCSDRKPKAQTRGALGHERCHKGACAWRVTIQISHREPFRMPRGGVVCVQFAVQPILTSKPIDIADLKMDKFKQALRDWNVGVPFNHNRDHVYSPNRDNCIACFGAVRGITVSAIEAPLSSSRPTSLSCFATESVVPSADGSRSSISSGDMPSSDNKSGEWVLSNTWRPDLRPSRAIMRGICRMTPVCSDNSGSSRSSGALPSNRTHNNPSNRSVPSENWSSVCQPALGR